MIFSRQRYSSDGPAAAIPPTSPKDIRPQTCRLMAGIKQMTMKLKLNIDDMTEEFFDGTRLLGVVAPVKDYQFCWLLNHRLRFDFRINHDIEIQLTKKQRKYFFGVYEYQEANNSLQHFLYNNQFDGEYLLPEFKHLDFLWLLKGDTVTDDKLGDLINCIKTMPSVQLVTELVQDKIRNKGHLIF
jgi:hypothetical protein